MALIFADGFDHYGTGPTGRLNMLKGQWASLASINDQPVTTYKRTGTHALYVPGGADILSLRGERFVVGVGFGQLVPSLPASDGHITGIVFYNQSGTGILTITVMPDGALRILKGPPTSSDVNLLDITDAVVMTGTFGHVEIKTVIDDIVGSIEVRYNGIVISHLTDLNLGVAGAASIGFINSVNGSGGVGQYIDDLVIWDDTGDFNNDFMGPQRVLTLFPVGDTVTADWTVVGAANGYAAIDQTAPDDDTTYLGSETVSDKSEFTLPELPSELASIAAVFVPAMARSDEAGVSSIKISIINDSEVAGGTVHELSPTYVYYRDAFNSDPATDGAWTKEGFESSLIRVEKTA